MKRLAWQFLGTLIVMALIYHFIWWIVGIAAVILGVIAGVKCWQHYEVSAEAEAKRLAAIEARADEQHNWVMQGDERGLFGQYPPAV